MVTLLENAMVFITSIFYQYFITLLILYIHSQLPCLLIARYQRAVVYVLYCVLVCVFFFSVSFTFCFVFLTLVRFNLVLGYTVVIL